MAGCWICDGTGSCRECREAAAFEDVERRDEQIASLTAKVERYEKAIGEAAVALEVLNANPPREFSREMREQVYAACIAMRAALSEAAPSREKQKVLDHMPCVCARKPAHKNASECVSGGPDRMKPATSGEEK